MFFSSQSRPSLTLEALDKSVDLVVNDFDYFDYFYYFELMDFGI